MHKEKGIPKEKKKKIVNERERVQKIRTRRSC